MQTKLKIPKIFLATLIVIATGLAVANVVIFINHSNSGETLSNSENNIHEDNRVCTFTVFPTFAFFNGIPLFLGADEGDGFQKLTITEMYVNFR